MNIGLDYDDTYTRDPVAWLDFIKLMQQRGHYVFLTTWRTPSECNDLDPELVDVLDCVYPTSRIAKEKFMGKQGIRVDVWIDDNPWSVTHTMEGWEQ